MATYEEIRPLLQSGDIAYFSSHRKIGDLLIKFWSKLVAREHTEFSHIGCVYVLEKRVFFA